MNRLGLEWIIRRHHNPDTMNQNEKFLENFYNSLIA